MVAVPWWRGACQAAAGSPRSAGGGAADSYGRLIATRLNLIVWASGAECSACGSLRRFVLRLPRWWRLMAFEQPVHGTLTGGGGGVGDHDHVSAPGLPVAAVERGKRGMVGRQADQHLGSLATGEDEQTLSVAGVDG